MMIPPLMTPTFSSKDNGKNLFIINVQISQGRRIHDKGMVKPISTKKAPAPYVDASVCTSVAGNLSRKRHLPLNTDKHEYVGSCPVSINLNKILVLAILNSLKETSDSLGRLLSRVTESLVFFPRDVTFSSCSGTTLETKSGIKRACLPLFEFGFKNSSAGSGPLYT